MKRPMICLKTLVASNIGICLKIVVQQFLKLNPHLPLIVVIIGDIMAGEGFCKKLFTFLARQNMSSRHLRLHAQLMVQHT